jgi:alanyl-tRNA synthetase
MENISTSLDVHAVYKAPNKQHLHHVRLAYGDVKVGDTLTLKLDHDRRYRIRKNHSAVHLLQASLKQYLGEHILQQGSFVGDDYARFDFSHPQKISEAELLTMEQDVNAMIQAAYPCVVETMAIEEARKTGATAPFQEKYGDRVRVVTLGPRSKEFCGGTHVNNTEEIGVFAIVSEESIAAGTRRLTVVSSQKAYAFLKQKEQTLNLIRDQVKATSSAEILDRLKAMQVQSQFMQKQLGQTQAHYASMVAKSYLNTIQNQPYPHVFIVEPTLSRALVIAVIDNLKVLAPQTMALVIGQDLDTYPIGCYVPASLQTPTRKANTVLKTFAQHLGGSGGGKADLAFGSGKHLEALAQAKQQALLL